MASEEVHQCPDFVMDVLREIAGERGIQRPRYTFQSGSQRGDGFIGVVTRVVIAGEDVGQEVRLICKHLKRDPHDDDIFTDMDMFRREIFIYRHVLPEFVALQREMKIPDDEGFFAFPSCHFAQESGDEIALIFDDLCAGGFKMLPRKQCPDFEHIRLLMIQLGRLHAVSFAMRQHKPEILQKFQWMDDNCSKFMRRKQMQPIASKNCRLVQTILRPEETELRAFFQRWETTMWTEVAELIRGENSEPWSVVNHGDCWINNLMYSHNQENYPEKICLIDWQASGYGPGVQDIHHFFFNSADKAFRDEHYFTCLDIYYESLGKLLSQLGGDVKKQFPRDVFEDHIKKFGKFGLAISTFSTPQDTEYVPIYDGEPEHTFNEANKEKYEERMRDNISDFIKFGFML